ncbi:MAG: right-handed parallel beta-helix repeat-containing protein [Armatimonadota bacterium]|nr:right-handed parallel beta-helix repeat-containing protein [Armatimonadota bacterium]
MSEKPFMTLCLPTFALAALLWTTLPTLAAAAESTADIRALLKNAVATRQARLVIPPGVYRIGPEKNEGIILTIRQARNLEIVADGVTMVCTKRMRALMFEQCENVTLRGLTLDYDPLTFTQGKVVAMADDKGWLDIKIDAGYPQTLFDRIVICDPKTRFHKYGIDHLWGTKASWAEPGTIRITRKDVARNVDLGDPVALSGGQEAGVCHGITVENKCSNVVFRNVTIHCAPGMGLVDFDNETGIKMFDCKIVPGPKPAGATEERLLTTSWDGIQCNVARAGTQIENCVIERCGDDSWSVPAREFKVVQRDGRMLLLSAPGGTPSPGGLRTGDRLIHRSQDGLVIQTIQTVQTVKREIAGTTASLIEATLEQELPVEAGKYLFNLDCSSKGFIYRNNRIYSHGRGALIKVSDGLIEGNAFRGSDKAIMVNPEFGSGGADRLVIRNNTIIETGYHQAMPWSEQAGALCLSSSAGGGKLRPAGAFNDILIENNTFDRVKGLNLLISSARNVTVKNNRFLNTHSTDPGWHNGADYKIDATAVIEVTQCDGVDFIGNVIENMGPFAKRAVFIDPSARNVTNVENGVRGTNK